MRGLLAALALLLMGCASADKNLAAYYSMQEKHDTAQVEQMTAASTAIRAAGVHARFETSAEASMFALLQAMIIKDLKYQPLNVAPPTTVNDIWMKAIGPLIGAANAWLPFWLLSRDGNTSYVAREHGTVNVHSGNMDSMNSAGRTMGTGPIDSTTSSVVADDGAIVAP